MQNHIYDLCKQHMHQHVLLQTTVGEQIAGVITNLDDENVYLTVPARSDDYYDESRQYSPYGGGPQYPPYGPGPQPGPRPGPNQLIIPLAALTAISLLPFI